MKSSRSHIRSTYGKVKIPVKGVSTFTDDFKVVSVRVGGGFFFLFFLHFPHYCQYRTGNNPVVLVKVLMVGRYLNTVTEYPVLP